MKINQEILSKIQKNITVDCASQSLGRISTQVANILMGKNHPQYRAYIDFPITVTLTNWKKIIFTGSKMKSKYYYRHSGFIGGLKQELLEDVWAKNPQKVILHSIEGMLPKNKLQSNRIKRVKFSIEDKNND